MVAMQESARSSGGLRKAERSLLVEPRLVHIFCVDDGGYGDVHASTQAGRLVSVVVSVVSMLMIALDLVPNLAPNLYPPGSGLALLSPS